MRFACLALLLAAVPLFAQTHDPFPADFTPPPCAPANSCTSFERSNFPSAAGNLLPNRPLSPQWLDQHADAVLKEFDLPCRRHASCLATAGNSFAFCDDVLYLETEPICERLFPREKNKEEYEQCSTLHDVDVLGVEFHAEDLWKSLQTCVKQHESAHTKPLEIWMKPKHLPANFAADVMFFALDPDTHVPILARIDFEGQKVYAPVNPAGNPVTFYPFKYTIKYVRVPNAEGHTDLVPPMVTISAPAYPEATGGTAWPVSKFRLAADVPKLIVEMTPKPERLRRGENHVTISARDAASGKPVEMRVIVGTDQIGNTNEPLTIDLPKAGHHPEIWLTSLYDKYSDVVVARER